ncbi:hypothetical protein AB0H51_21690 [Streptomyces griseoluteus]|uniref:hypothetical protein n=1 Tax=Streptomyces griseoluteus TaxID=29306 RepID=UPI0033D1F2BC
MSPDQSPRDAPGVALANQVEGYLLLHAEKEQARRAAGELCARLPWLTTAQAEEVTRHYIAQQMGLTRQAVQASADRAHRMRAAYETRYACLRRTLLKWHAACASCVLAAASTAGTASYLLSR